MVRRRWDKWMRRSRCGRLLFWRGFGFEGSNRAEPHFPNPEVLGRENAFRRPSFRTAFSCERASWPFLVATPHNEGLMTPAIPLEFQTTKCTLQVGRERIE